MAERTCKKCFHYNACKEVASHSGYADINYTESQCKNFISADDVVKVIRCKTCKHATFYSCKNDACYKAIICEYKIGIGDENFYCACAEPRTPKERGAE